MFGAFQIIPLKGLKWKLRFEATQSPKLTKDKSVAWQVRSRRLLSEGSAKLLEDVLLKTQLAQEGVEVQEGKTTHVTLTQRERSRELRVLALASRGTVCEVCGFDFAETYGEFAKHCVEVHHLELLAGAGREGVTTSMDDVLVVCPNCHRALHQFRDPGDWKAFRKACRLG
jgi:5-methylcytosine-specific restriction protein A